MLITKAFECFEFGRVAYEENDFYHAIRWLNDALEQVEFEGNQPSVSKTVIIDLLAFAHFKVNF